IRRLRTISQARCPQGTARSRSTHKGSFFMPKIVFVNEKQEIEVPDGANLRQEARKAGIQLYKGIHRIANCRGLGLCGSCKVLVKKGMENLSPKGRLERFTLATAPTCMLAVVGHEDEMRLACQC